MKAIFFSCMIALILAACAPAKSDVSRDVRIVTVPQGATSTFVLRNETPEPVKVSETFAFAGVGGGNVFLLALDDQDKLSSPCRVLDSPPHDMVKNLAPGAEVELWHGEMATLADWYCLRPGKYSAVLGYRFPDGKLIFSETFVLMSTASVSGVD